MADRYWRGGSGSWNTTFNWSTTSGGTGNASVPTAADNVIFDANSGVGSAHYIVTVTDNATCANLTFTPETAIGVTEFVVGSGFVIAGTFSTSSTAGNRRLWIRSSTYGLMRDMQIAAIGSVSDVDFRDIRVTGAGGTLSGTRIGDLRGNSGITFNTPKTVYWTTATNSTFSGNNWATTIGGAASTDNFPLAQDTATFTNTGLNVSATASLDGVIPYIGSVNMSARTNAMTLNITAAIAIYGNWTNGSGTTIFNTGALTFSGRNTQTITSAGKTFSGGITIDSYGGSVELADALNIGSNAITVTNGTFDTKGYAVTAGSLSSNNSNVRTINLGASTVSLSNTGVVLDFTTITNLTFNAGTSQITLSSASSDITFVGGGAVFYNLSFTGTALFSRNLIGTNTFNNLTVAAPASIGFIFLQFVDNQTINGTLTVSGASPIRRIFARSNTLGTQRDLTVGTLVATDCDFRDIDILGAAAGSTPTRAGDCGGNAGITFPAPKTVYWEASNNNNWSNTVWASVSNGTPDINNFPLAQDTAVIDQSSGTSIGVAINAAWNIGTVDMSARLSSTTFTTGTNALYVHGNWLFGTGVSSTSSTGPITFVGRGTQTITSNGVDFGCPINVDAVTGTVQLADALTLGVTRTLTLTSGTFDAVSYNVTTGLFSAGSAALGAVLKMGSGTWTLAGVGTVFSISTNATLYKGTANIVLSSPSTSARTFNGNGFAYNKLTIGGSATSTTTISGNNTFTEFESNKNAAHTIALGTTAQVFGKWSVTGSTDSPVTITGTGASHIIAGQSVSGVNNLIMGTVGFSINSLGAFYAGPNSTGSGNGVIKTDAPTPRTLYWVGGTGNWSNTARWSLTSGGTGGAAVPTSFDNVIFDSASSAGSYTSTIDQNAGAGINQHRCNELTISGPASGVLTLTGISCPIMIHGSVTMPVSGLNFSYSSVIYLTGSTPGKVFTTNGNQLSVGVVVNGIGCEWSLGSGLTAQAQSVAIYNGKFDFGSYNSALQFVQIVKSFGDTDSVLNLNSSTLSLLSATPLILSNANIKNHITLPGTSQLNLGNASPVFPYFQSGVSTAYNSNINTFHNVAWTSTGVGTAQINGPNTFNNLAVSGLTSSGVKNISVTADQTINGTLTLSAGTNATMRTFVRSDAIGTTRTLTCAAVAAPTDIDFRDITIAGVAAPVSGTRLGDCKGNSGITFDAAKTVYWNQSGGGNWSQIVWALATGTGAATAVNNFPLAQDTAVFQALSGTLNSGATTTINAAYNIGTIDMSARTTNTMTLATGSQAPAIYGNWINGTGTTLTGTGTMTFAGRTSQTITSAGKAFTQAIAVDSPGGSVTLQDALAWSNTNGLSLSKGTFDANGYNVTTLGGVTVSGINTRTIALGSGTWTLAATSTGAWNVTTSTNLTITGTGTISLTSASAKTFAGGSANYSGITLNQGGAGALTITGNNTFGNITNTYKATGATSIALGNTTQRVGAFGAAGEVGRVLTVTGSSATSPATLVFTGSGQATTPTTDYLTITGIRAYNLTDTWYAGNNSTNNGSLGWYFIAGSAPPISVSYGNFFMFF